MRLLLLRLSVLSVAAVQPWPVAADPPANGVVITSLEELPYADSLVEQAERLWLDFLDLFRFGQGHSHYAPRSAEVDHTNARTRDDFGALMEIAGYKLKEIESNVGVVPTLHMTFGQVRELTEADREFVERHLQRHAHRNAGPLATVQRMIVRTVVEASEIGTFAVEKVGVEFFPLPQVKFVFAPVDSPLSLDAAMIMRGIDRLNRKLEQMPAARGGGAALPEERVPAVRTGRADGRAG